MKKAIYLILFVLLFAFGDAFSQSTFVPVGQYSYPVFDRLSIQYGKVLPYDVHTNVKPYSRRRVGDFVDSLIKINVTLNKRTSFELKYLINDNSEWVNDTVIPSRKAVWNFFYKEPATLIGVNTKNFILKINPVLRFELGDENGVEDRPLFISTRGVELRGSIKKRISFYTFLTDNQTRAMTYVKNRGKAEQAIPGEGYWKEYKTDGYDYFSVRGYVNFNVLDHVDIQVGHDKNFWGNGYRSLFLSDFSNNYFFLKLQTTIWRISYTNLFTQFIGNYNRGVDQLLPKKYGAFHHINIHCAHWLDIGLFEGVIYQRDFELQYLNPIIFYRAVEQALGSPDNSLIGLDFKANIARTAQVYGQVMFDELNFRNLIAANGWWANKFGIQTGFKYINAFRIPNLDLQGEFNIIRPYTYTHNTTASYTHYNQPLAHPLGANFWEIVAIARYQLIPGLDLTAKYFFFQKGMDSSGTNFGGNIFLPNVDAAQSLAVNSEFGNSLGQGVKARVSLLNLLLSYQLRHNLFFDANVIFRRSVSDNANYNTNEIFYAAGVRLNIPYRSFDY
ncbi:MAG: hypothetical protein SFW35_12890 [Chitinophagales bacterium]|nr:hypothetical protein [Chitinophagales bacterium]